MTFTKKIQTSLRLGHPDGGVRPRHSQPCRFSVVRGFHRSPCRAIRMETRRHIFCLCPGVSGRNACHGRHGLARRSLRGPEADDRVVHIDKHGHGSPGDHQGALALLRILRAICWFSGQRCLHGAVAGYPDPLVQSAHGPGVRHLLGCPGGGTDDFCPPVPLADR